MEHSEKLLYLVADSVSECYVRSLNDSAESLRTLYKPDAHRRESYQAMIHRILEEVRAGKNVCAAFYGHPGVFVHPSHEAIRQAKREGFEARMYPAISSEDCLFADLGIDPSLPGCASFEATDFLIFRRAFDVNSQLILWQIGVIGEFSYKPGGFENRGLEVLVDYLSSFYGGDHGVVVYQGSPYPVGRPRVEQISLAALRTTEVTAVSTLYVPPKGISQADGQMMTRLGVCDLDIDRIAVGRAS